jgi:hypothetical protein
MSLPSTGPQGGRPASTSDLQRPENFPMGTHILRIRELHRHAAGRPLTAVAAMAVACGVIASSRRLSSLARHAAAASPLKSFTPTMAPAAANAIAMPRPMPLPAPVTR